MNVEENRLRTFNTWPANSVIEPARIAKGGFYATGRNLEVQCFACNGIIDDWNYGDQVMVRHKNLNPLCPFVLNPNNSGNITTISSASSSSSSSIDRQTTNDVSVVDRNDMSSEANRLLTFGNWPASNIVSPEDLAKAGFYYLNDTDRVKCFKCKGIVGHWENGDRPISEHKRHFPTCEFIRFVLSPGEKSIISTAYNEQLITNENFQDLGIHLHRDPHRPQYATIESRLRSFIGWPNELVQTPESLSEAGFYYTGTGDQVRCFHCDGGLRRWDPQDDPWTEHARCFPGCGFLLLYKGQVFVNSCQPNDDHKNALHPTMVDRQSRTPIQIRTVTDEELQHLMDSPDAQAALSIGLHVGRVKQAIKYRVEQFGVTFDNVDDLIEAALNVQLEEPDSAEEYDNQLSATVSRILSDAVCQTMNTSDHNVPQQIEKNKIEITDKSDLETSNVSMPMEEENRRLREARLCKICLDKEVGVVFLPCGHLTTCTDCAPSLKQCPVCRSAIKAFVRTFLS